MAQERVSLRVGPARTSEFTDSSLPGARQGRAASPGHRGTSRDCATARGVIPDLVFTCDPRTRPGPEVPGGGEGVSPPPEAAGAAHALESLLARLARGALALQVLVELGGRCAGGPLRVLPSIRGVLLPAVIAVAVDVPVVAGIDIVALHADAGVG